MRRPPPGVLAVLLAGLFLCTWNLGARALWQDEAACALLGQRLLEHGRPLGYADGVLITMDTTAAEELATLAARAREPEAAVGYFVRRGDFRGDTTWIGQPWGSLAVAGLSLEVLGRSAWAARLPFALAGVLTVLLLYRLARSELASARGALLASALLAGNVFWLTHTRQCRYYGAATLLGLATFALYLRWRRRVEEDRGRPRDAALFVAAAWLWFHQDFGSFWPVIGVLLAGALLRGPGRRGTLVAFAGLGAAVLPFALYYRLHDRLKPAALPFDERLGGLAWMLDRYQLPLLVLAAGAVLAWRLRGRARGARAAGLALACVAVELLWMAAVSPAPFYRYVVDLTPLSALATAWVVTLAIERAPERLRAPAFVAAAAVLLVTPWAALPTSSLFAPPHRLFDPGSALVRSELSALRADLFGDLPDPNRAVARFLAERLEPGDEVVVNYEDLPLAFHLGIPVRGGIPCFRVLDEPPPRWLVVRRSAGFVPPEPYQRLERRHAWRHHPGVAPDVPFGNNPDPRFHRVRFEGAPSLLLLERR